MITIKGDPAMLQEAVMEKKLGRFSNNSYTIREDVRVGTVDWVKLTDIEMRTLRSMWLDNCWEGLISLAYQVINSTRRTSRKTLVTASRIVSFILNENFRALANYNGFDERLERLVRYVSPSVDVYARKHERGVAFYPFANPLNLTELLSDVGPLISLRLEDTFRWQVDRVVYTFPTLDAVTASALVGEEVSEADIVQTKRSVSERLTFKELVDVLHADGIQVVKGHKKLNEVGGKVRPIYGSLYIHYILSEYIAKDVDG
ncbi:unnamed protein product [Lepeophtheirus salmonis]|uniref:(salmon louse) hypothetical protein n=1 Tax=Lepeophtheirus salmonis TaxID=72036 RepID=A0A7R8H467_LEPSM|nr:unnamed protein product [Lepeophtheirus salmonis]CAF2853847.1 unnamed protein product [Lepeophtheirus salmonis]